MLNAPRQVHGQVVQLPKWSFLPPIFELRHCDCRCLVFSFKVFEIGDEDRGMRDQLDNMALATNTVMLRIIFDLAFLEEHCDILDRLGKRDSNFGKTLALKLYPSLG